MYQLNEPLTFTVPLSFEAHSLAEQFWHQQSSPQKAKQVYLNTLAVYAVDFYLRCLGIETEINKSDSHNPLCLKFMNVADLYVKSIGKLECRPVLPESRILEIPVEVREDRVGYVAIQFDPSLKQAILIGFTPTGVEIPLSELSAIADFPEYLNQFKQPILPRVNLSQWLDNYFEQGWQKLEDLFSLDELTPAFSMRSSFMERGKQICLTTQVTQQTIILVVKLNPQSENGTNIIVEARPQSGRLYLPENLQVKVLNEHKEAVMQATASSSNQNIQFDFNVDSGECFSLQITLGEDSVIEDFVT